LGLGLLIVLAELRLPLAFERGAELLVALMLIGFGLWHAVLIRKGLGESAVTAASAVSGFARPVLLGLVHGIAGSAGIALLAAATIASRSLAVAYLGLVALGTVLGMVTLTVVMSRPLSWATRREGRLQQGITLLAASLSLVLGASMLLHVTTGGGD
jgi:hypothetical protein